MQVIYRYFAIKPLNAEHPVGSGIIVQYRPGEEVPANEWGRATANLVAMDKIARVAFNVDDDVEEMVIPQVANGPRHVTPEEPKKRGPGRPRKNP